MCQLAATTFRTPFICSQNWMTKGLCKQRKPRLFCNNSENPAYCSRFYHCPNKWKLPNKRFLLRFVFKCLVKYWQMYCKTGAPIWVFNMRSRTMDTFVCFNCFLFLWIIFFCESIKSNAVAGNQLESFNFVNLSIFKGNFFFRRNNHEQNCDSVFGGVGN